MTTSHLAPRANLGGALQPRISTALKPAGIPFRRLLGGLITSSRRLLAAGGFLFLAVHAFASPSVTLAWDASVETDIARYQLGYGTTPGVYPNVVDAGMNTEITVSNLEEGKNYYFAVAAVNTAGLKSSYSEEISYSTEPAVISPSGKSVTYVDSVDPQTFQTYQPAYAVDGDPNTFWHTAWTSNVTPPPHEIQINLGAVQDIIGFRYLPRQDSYLNGTVGQFEFYVSLDGVNWGNPVVTGTFPNTHDLKEARFASKSVQFIRFRGLTDANGSNFMAVAELEVIQDSEPPITNEAPLAQPISITIAEDTTPIAITLSGFDKESSLLTYSIVSHPAKGTLAGTPPNLTYTPSPDYNGSDSFTFLVNDGTVNSAPATVSITVVPVNDAPVAIAKSVTTPQGASLAITLTGSDKETTTLAYSVVSGPADGTLSGTPPNLTYLPNTGFSGSDAFTFKAGDEAAQSTAATISITVTPSPTVVPVNSAPVFSGNPISATASEDSAFSGKLIATDANAGDVLTFRKISGPAWLTVDANGVLGGTPLNSDVGSNSFTVGVSDPSNASATATLIIKVVNINDSPSFKSSSLTVAAGTEKTRYFKETLVGTAADPDAGDKIVFSKISGPSWLAVAKTGALTGTPPSGSAGLNQFVVRASDTSGAFSDSTLQITIKSTTLPLPWSLDSLGADSLSGSATYDSGTFTLSGAGVLTKTQDTGNFGWQILSGDGQIIARVRKFDDSGSSPRVGVMIRESLAPNSRSAFVGVNGNGSYQWINHPKSGGKITKVTRKNLKSDQVWLRLVRLDDTITAYTSQNGKAWLMIGKSKVKLSKNCYIGLSVSSGDKDTLNVSKFSNVRVKS
ncbi:MAG: Ig-like domain-containing protein [Verrucomicrobiota bacterium]